MSADNAFCLGILASSGIVLLAILLTQRWVNKKTEGGSVKPQNSIEWFFGKPEVNWLPPDPALSIKLHKCSFHGLWLETYDVNTTRGKIPVRVYECSICGTIFIELKNS